MHEYEEFDSSAFGQLNAALALEVSEKFGGTPGFNNHCIQGIVLAKDILRSGEAWVKLEQIAAFLKN